MKAHSQTVHACSHTFSGSENGRSGHQDSGARLDCKPGSRRIYAPVHLQAARGLDPLDHLADAPDLWQSRLDEMLMPETWVDRHYQYLINVRQDLLQRCCRGGRVDHHAGALAQLLNAFDCAMQVRVAFPMNEKRIGAGL